MGSAVVVSLRILSVPPHESLTVNHACSLPCEIISACDSDDVQHVSVTSKRVIEMVLLNPSKMLKRLLLKREEMILLRYLACTPVMQCRRIGRQLRAGILSGKFWMICSWTL